MTSREKEHFRKASKWGQLAAFTFLGGLVAAGGFYFSGDHSRTGMFLDFQWALFLTSATLVFISYQSIPASLMQLEAAEKYELQSNLLTSSTFTAFVRVCGVGHLVMAIAMLLAGTNPQHVALAAWMLVCSEGVVAFISVTSAWAHFTATYDAIRDAEENDH